MKITVVGLGYVGTSNAIILAQHNEVHVLDVSEERINNLNNGISPIEDKLGTEMLRSATLNISGTTDKQLAYENAEYAIIAVPTDYNPETKYFNTSLVKGVIKDMLAVNPNCIAVIKSTIPIGYVDNLRKELNTENIIFSPEFLREGNAVKDNLHPDRIIVGEQSPRAEIFAGLLKAAAIKDNICTVLMDSTEAEAVKLFSNSYLAMRVAYFNELDAFCETNNLNAEQIVRGVSADHRIGNHYNNPSFGYGGYCFVKDTKQLLANFNTEPKTPNNLISAVVHSNDTRKQFIIDSIIEQKAESIGIFRLTMKADSDNFRNAAIFDIITALKNQNKNIIIYEPTIKETNFDGIPVVNNIEEFSKMSDLIVTNRIESDLEPYLDKVYTRDIFSIDL